MTLNITTSSRNVPYYATVINTADHESTLDMVREYCTETDIQISDIPDHEIEYIEEYVKGSINKYDQVFFWFD